MKKLLLLLTISFMSCQDDLENKPFTIIVLNGSGWSQISTTVKCDSFKMITPFECKAYYNGTEMIIKGEMLTPQSN